MRYEVPQFIDVEDKIFGPLTFRQFAYLAGGAGLCYLTYKVVPTFIAIVIMLPLAAFSLALAFVKVNQKPLINVVESAINYLVRGKLYLWKKEPEKKKKQASKTDAELAPVYAPRLSESKLHDIAWGLDVLNTKGR